MRTKHTLGPWVIGSSDTPDYMGDMEPGGLYVQQQDGSRAVICEMDNITENREANAKLIAAAPDLLRACHKGLAALQDIINASDHDPYSTEELLAEFQDDFECIEAAIAKAEEGQRQ